MVSCRNKVSWPSATKMLLCRKIVLENILVSGQIGLIASMHGSGCLRREGPALQISFVWDFIND